MRKIIKNRNSSIPKSEVIKIVSATSHDIKNMLSVLRAHTQLIERVMSEENIKSAKLKGYLKKIDTKVDAVVDELTKLKKNLLSL